MPLNHRVSPDMFILENTIPLASVASAHIHARKQLNMLVKPSYPETALYQVTYSKRGEDKTTYYKSLAEACEYYNEL